MDRTWSALLPAPPLQTTQQTLLSGINSLHTMKNILKSDVKLSFYYTLTEAQLVMLTEVDYDSLST